MIIAYCTATIIYANKITTLLTKLISFSPKQAPMFSMNLRRYLRVSLICSRFPSEELRFPSIFHQPPLYFQFKKTLSQSKILINLFLITWNKSSIRDCRGKTSTHWNHSSMIHIFTSSILTRFQHTNIIQSKCLFTSTLPINGWVIWSRLRQTNSTNFKLLISDKKNQKVSTMPSMISIVN